MSDDQADLLRRAADRLDRLAGDAVLTPWRIVPNAEFDQMPHIVGFGRETAPASVTVARDVVNAEYIATMHPGVGKAFAVWLRTEWQNCQESVFFADCTPQEQEDFIAMPLAVARAILDASW